MCLVKNLSTQKLLLPKEMPFHSNGCPLNENENCTHLSTDNGIWQRSDTQLRWNHSFVTYRIRQCTIIHVYNVHSIHIYVPIIYRSVRFSNDKHLKVSDCSKNMNKQVHSIYGKKLTFEFTFIYSKIKRFEFLSEWQSFTFFFYFFFSSVLQPLHMFNRNRHSMTTNQPTE